MNTRSKWPHPPVRFGWGATREVGMDLADWGVRRVMLLTDPVLSRLEPVSRAREALEAAGISYDLFDRARVELTHESFLDAVEFARAGEFEGFVAVGGGSTIDTAKAANL